VLIDGSDSPVGGLHVEPGYVGRFAFGDDGDLICIDVVSDDSSSSSCSQIYPPDR
jgi:hypothetical protein